MERKNKMSGMRISILETSKKDFERKWQVKTLKKWGGELFVYLEGGFHAEGTASVNSQDGSRPAMFDVGAEWKRGRAVGPEIRDIMVGMGGGRRWDGNMVSCVNVRRKIILEFIGTWGTRRWRMLNGNVVSIPTKHKERLCPHKQLI